jgi:hypothetical protein
MPFEFTSTFKNTFNPYNLNACPDWPNHFRLNDCVYLGVESPSDFSIALHNRSYIKINGINIYFQATKVAALYQKFRKYWKLELILMINFVTNFHIKS